MPAYLQCCKCYIYEMVQLEKENSKQTLYYVWKPPRAVTPPRVYGGMVYPNQTD